MNIDEIERTTFPISRRGYDRADVDAFLSSIAAEYRATVAKYQQAIDEAKDAVRSAATDAAALTNAQTFQSVGTHVTSILAMASQAAENLKAEAEQEIDDIRTVAQEEAAELKRSAESAYVEATAIKAKVEKEAAALRTSARSEASAIMAEARSVAAQIEQETQEQAAQVDRVSRANVAATVAEGRREYEHLRALQQQLVDRMSSVEFLIQQARDGLSGRLAIASEPISPTITNAGEVEGSPRKLRFRKSD